MIYSKIWNKRKTSQSQSIPGSEQVPNNAGGFVWTLNPWAVLDRFLILGSEGGTYYVKESKLTLDCATKIIALIHEDGERVVQKVVEVSFGGRAPKNDPAVFTLALCASLGDEKVRAAALHVLPMVCRTGTHLFQFAEACNNMRGWGRGLKKAISGWYNGRSVEDLEYQLVKYQSRNGWSNRDLLRLSHPKPASEAHGELFKWACGKGEAPNMPRVQAMEMLKAAQTSDQVAEIIRSAALPREVVPTEWLTKAEVWDALLDNMPMTALIRNLGNMTKIGLLERQSSATAKVVGQLMDYDKLRKARVHPMTLLMAMKTYQSGRGLRGSGMWDPVPIIVDALDQAFYASFANVQATGKRMMLGIDVSGSMTYYKAAGSAISACEVATAMAMVAVETEKNVSVLGFASEFRPLPLKRGMTLKDAMKVTTDNAFGSTDCAVPMLYAAKNKIPVDVFVVYTDNETWAGNIHPSQALERYRKVMGIPAKLIVVGITATEFSIANPNDPGMLDVVGFDTSVPEVMAHFMTQ